MNEINTDYVFSLLNVEDLIDHYKLQGHIVNDDFIGCCPLHNDKKPSFSLNIKTGLWICWGCTEQGNIFQLIQNLENFSFKEALEWLMKFVGVDVNAPNLDYGNQLLKKLNTVFNNDEENELKIVSLPKDCEDALKYFKIASKRVSKQDIKTFKIKYCSKGFYKGYLIFPLYFEKKLIAYFARDVFDRTEKTKVYNSGAPIGKIFYNWDDAIQNSEYVIVVEGILDCIKVCSWGYNCIALLGINLSIKKRTLLLKHFDSIFIVLDNDYKEKYNNKGELIISNPGQLAAQKLISTLYDEVKIYNVMLPVNKDPDECTEKEFTSALKKAKRWKKI